MSEFQNFNFSVEYIISKEKTNVKIEFIDERLSSVMAEELLKETERDWKKRKEKLDAVAASILLQDYLDAR